jgi:hypothetical protein
VNSLVKHINLAVVNVVSLHRHKCKRTSQRKSFESASTELKVAVIMEIDGETKQRKLYYITENLKEFHSKLSYDIQTRIPLENLSFLGKLLIHSSIKKKF